jgi:hypothetical protein
MKICLSIGCWHGLIFLGKKRAYLREENLKGVLHGKALAQLSNIRLG